MKLSLTIEKLLGIIGLSNKGGTHRNETTRQGNHII